MDNTFSAIVTSQWLFLLLANALSAIVTSQWLFLLLVNALSRAIVTSPGLFLRLSNIRISTIVTFPRLFLRLSNMLSSAIVTSQQRFRPSSFRNLCKEFRIASRQEEGVERSSSIWEHPSARREPKMKSEVEPS